VTTSILPALPFGPVVLAASVLNVRVGPNAVSTVPSVAYALHEYGVEGDSPLIAWMIVSDPVPPVITGVVDVPRLDPRPYWNPIGRFVP
jgi:hypothetical protein